jgi:hypothetical protein
MTLRPSGSNAFGTHKYKWLFFATTVCTGIAQISSKSIVE